MEEPKNRRRKGRLIWKGQKMDGAMDDQWIWAKKERVKGRSMGIGQKRKAQWIIDMDGPKMDESKGD